MEEELYALGIDGFLGGIDDALQHEVGFLQLVPEEKVVLREVDGEGVGTLGKVGAQHIESAEHPAAARGLLVGDALLLGLYAEPGIQLTRIGLILCQIVDGVGCQRIAQGTVGSRRSILLLYLLQHLLRDTAALSMTRESHANEK